MDPAIVALWAQATVFLRPETVRLHSFPVERAAEVAAAALSAGPWASVVLERDELSAAAPEAAGLAALEPRHRSGPLRVLTVDLDLELTVHGFLSPALMRLAAARIPVVPQCAYLKERRFDLYGKLPYTAPVGHSARR